MRSMDLSLRPEYDTSGALIIYDFTLANTAAAAYDGEVWFHVPKGATKQVHVCEQVDGNKHAICRPYTTTNDGDESTLTWTPSKPIGAGQSYPLYIEYYYNPIQGKGTKTVDFRYHPSYPVDQLNLDVAQPARSSGFTLEPAATGRLTADDGLTYYTYNLKNGSADNPLELKVSYTKEDNRPSVVTAGTSGAVAQPGSRSTVAAVAALILAAFGGMMALGLRSPRPQYATGRPGASRPRRESAPRSRPKASAAHPNGSGTAGSAGSAARPAPVRDDAQELLRMARRRLLEGKISEETYQAIVRDIEEGRG
ncbi:MAG: hypothetical protein M1602_00185 [Firmicutes bacterium]|nr:hypothetical protein [Bacillota bacterium]